MEDLADQVKNYRTPDDAKSLVASMQIALIAGVAAAGKDSILHGLLADQKHFARIITTVPRAPRPGETEGISYYFIDEARVRRNLAERKYFETKLVHGRVYGTTTAELSRIAEQQKIAIGDVDVQGVEEYHRVLGAKLHAIFVIPPSFQIWQTRWANRGDATNADEKKRRVASAEAELDFALRADYYHFIVNDDLAQTISVAKQLILDPIFAKNYDDKHARQIAQTLHDDIKNELGGQEYQFAM